MCFFKVINPDILPHPAEPNSIPPNSSPEDVPTHTPTADGYEFDIDPCCIKRPLVVFIGGFADEISKVMLETCENYKIIHDSYQDIYYRPHDQGEVVLDFVEKYAAAGQKVAIIGHSWGGNTAVNSVAMKTKAKIDILATLDPVDKLGNKIAPASKPDNVLKYINVYINYLEAETSSLANSVARAGGPWQNVACADKNYDIINETKQNQYGRPPDHADASWMFTKYIQQLVKSLR